MKIYQSNVSVCVETKTSFLTQPAVIIAMNEIDI